MQHDNLTSWAPPLSPPLSPPSFLFKSEMWAVESSSTSSCLQNSVIATTLQEDRFYWFFFFSLWTFYDSRGSIEKKILGDITIQINMYWMFIVSNNTLGTAAINMGLCSDEWGRHTSEVIGWAMHTEDNGSGNILCSLRVLLIGSQSMGGGFLRLLIHKNYLRH